MSAYPSVLCRVVNVTLTFSALSRPRLQVKLTDVPANKAALSVNFPFPSPASESTPCLHTAEIVAAAETVSRKVLIYLYIIYVMRVDWMNQSILEHHILNL